MVCTQCGKENGPEWKYCVHCGSALQSSLKNNCCPQCGSKIAEGFAFCTECGTKLDTKVSPEKSLDYTCPRNRILKQEIFRYRERTIGLGEKGTLTLYSDKLDWSGDSHFTILIDSIVTVSVSDGFGTGALIISDSGGGSFKFQKNNNTTTALGLLGDWGVAAMADKKIADLEIWRQMIEKLRGSL